MIDKTQIRNFQGYRNVEIDWDPGLNVIVGSSDKGKSTIIRAFEWWAFNKPRGDSFRNWDVPKKAKVRITNFFDGISVSRIKDKKGDCYQIGDQDPFQAIGTTVPGPVQKLINMEPHQIENQYARFFLINETPGKRAKILNSIAGFSITDEIQKKANSKFDKTDKKADILKLQIEEIEPKIKELEWTKKADIELGVLESIENEMDILVEEAQSISSNLSELKTVRQDLQAIQEKRPGAVKAALNELITCNDNLKKETASRDEIRTILTGIKNTRNQLIGEKLITIKKEIEALIAYNETYKAETETRDEIQVILTGIRKARKQLIGEKLVDTKEEVENFFVQWAELDTLERETTEISKVLSHLKSHQKQLERITTKKKTRIQRFEDLKKEFKIKFDKCPLCNGVIK